MTETTITQQTRYDYAASVIKTLAPDLRPRVVFDVGAGAAPMRARAEDAGLAWFGFDLHPGNSIVSRWDLSDPCPKRDEKAGLVLLMDVLEHLENPGLALDHIAEVIDDKSYLLLSTPNPRWSRSRLDALWTGFPACFTRKDLAANHHVFPVWPHVLEHMLKVRSFETLEWCQLRGRTNIPKPALQPRYPLRVAKAMICRLIEATDPTAASIDYAVLARKKG